MPKISLTDEMIETTALPVALTEELDHCFIQSPHIFTKKFQATTTTASRLQKG
jgi:hypothetical protein